MEKLSKLLNKYNKRELYKEKVNRSVYRRYKKVLMRQGLYYKIENDQDFINFEIIKTSYDNMEKIQEEFFKIRGKLDDLWDVLSYQEKHFLLYKELSPFMDSLKYFYFNDKRCFIAYFDELINAFYDHDMLMFDKEAFRKFLYDFKKITIPIDKYGILPLKSNFSQTDFIVGDNDNYILYSKAINKFYHYDGFLNSYGMSKQLDDSQVIDVANLLLNNDKLKIINYLTKNNLGHKRLIKKLRRLKEKMIKHL